MITTTFNDNSKALMISHGKTRRGILSQSDFCFSAATINKISESLAIMNTSRIVISKAEILLSSAVKLNPLNVSSCVQYHTNLISPDIKLNIAIIIEPVCSVKQKQQRLSGPKLRVKSSSSVVLRWFR